jgi:hypothetical protein
MICPTLSGYIAFLTNVVQLEMENLPPFAGLGTLVEGSTTLTLTAVTTGDLVQWAIVTDANSAIPANTTCGGAISPVPPVGIGTYLLSQAALSSQSTPEAITATNQWIVWTFGVALKTVNRALAIAGELYNIAVYNLATDRLLNWAPDIEGQTYFQDLRRDMKLTRPALGVASSGSDQGTSGAVLNPDFMRALTMADLQTLKTPFGREYMGIAQQFGPDIFGLG